MVGGWWGDRHLSASFRDRDLQVLWEDGERVFCRGWQQGSDGSRRAVLVVLPATEHAPPASLDRLAHEYGLKDLLGGAPAVRPLALGMRVPERELQRG
jgi:hypothetical protein